jgi:hypothetical protein
LGDNLGGRIFRWMNKQNWGVKYTYIWKEGNKREIVGVDLVKLRS